MNKFLAFLFFFYSTLALTHVSASLETFIYDGTDCSPRNLVSIMASGSGNSGTCVSFLSSQNMTNTNCVPYQGMSVSFNCNNGTNTTLPAIASEKWITLDYFTEDTCKTSTEALQESFVVDKCIPLEAPPNGTSSKSFLKASCDPLNNNGTATFLVCSDNACSVNCTGTPVPTNTCQSSAASSNLNSTVLDRAFFTASCRVANGIVTAVGVDQNNGTNAKSSATSLESDAIFTIPILIAAFLSFF